MSNRFKYLVALNFFVSFGSLMLEQAAVLTLLTKWGAAYQSIVLVAASAPYVCFAGIIGRLCDKYARGDMISVSRALEVPAAAALIWFKFDNIFVLIAVLALKATANTTFEVAKYGFIAETVAPTKLNKANGWIVPGMHGGAILGFICSSFLMSYGAEAVIIAYVAYVCVANVLTYLLDATKRARPALSPWAWPIDPAGVVMLWEVKPLFKAVLASVGFYFALNFWFPAGLNAIFIQQYGTDEAYIASVGFTLLVALIIGSLAMMLPGDAVSYSSSRLGIYGVLLGLGVIAYGTPGGTGAPFVISSLFGYVAFSGSVFMVTNDATIQFYLPHAYRGRVAGTITFATHCLVLLSGVAYGATAVFLDKFGYPPSYCLLVPIVVTALILPLLFGRNVKHVEPHS